MVEVKRGGGARLKALRAPDNIGTKAGQAPIGLVGAGLCSVQVTEGPRSA